MFSRRAQWSLPINRLTLERRRHKGPLFDLTGSNPTRAGIPYPEEELAEALARGARAPYDPDPRGIRSAREALGAELGCEPEDLLLTASTSEAYSFLFKLLTDPGDIVLAPTPSYPLIEHLAAMEQVGLRTFPLEFQQRWEHPDVMVPPRTRAIVVVNPNNPTGSFVAPHEQAALASHGIPIISDEVFLPYPIEGSGSTFLREELLTFTLGGLSKSAGLPHFKLGWIRVNGPGKRQALDALELIADSFLSVATPVQVALPSLLRIAPRIREAISQRVRHNLNVLQGQMKPSMELLPVEGGWSAVIRVPRILPDEELALALLAHGVVVQPGYFFDFEADGFLVVSLLTPTETFAEGVRRLTDMIEA